jgi:hypothetical protein
MNNHTFPQTDSIRELAAFWDTHDLTDFEDQLEEVRERVFERPAKFTVELDADDAGAVSALAKSRGIKGSDLIREWVREKVRDTSRS